MIVIENILMTYSVFIRINVEWSMEYFLNVFII